MPQFNSHKKKFIIFDIIFTILLIIIDLMTKKAAVSYLKDKAAFPIIRNVLELHYLENHGAAFGMLQNQKTFFIIIAILICLVISYILLMLPDDKRYTRLHFILCTIAGGALGNMFDRFNTGYVIDFIYFKLINFPIFNVADIYVTVSTFLLVYFLLFYYKEEDFAFLSFYSQKTAKKAENTEPIEKNDEADQTIETKPCDNTSTTENHND
ncbi:signal peptidase II [Butyrivibrio sp. MC2013]|uniref:signal peptidase II n=1 Tax=Butyrivibrio sp. MC2013 TaxID=1280686 RepID=UPI00040070E5|nr:signal peptidase II [Butyrivibrio sp. MC2013]